MNILIFLIKLIVNIVLLPFRIVQFLWDKHRGELDEYDFDDEYYDADAQGGAIGAPGVQGQRASEGGLNYDVADYSDFEISNDRAVRAPNGRGPERGAQNEFRPYAPNQEAIREHKIAEVKRENLILNHNALFVRHEDRQVLVVDYELPSPASWLEFQSATQHFTIVMIDGGVAHINLAVENSYISDISKESRILLITNVNKKKVVHHLMFRLN